MEMILRPWPWFLVGPLIAFTMVMLLFFGKSFGLSSNLRTMCTISGAGKFSEFFRFDWKTQKWNLLFILGVAIGSFLTNNYLVVDQNVAISAETVQDLAQYGIEVPESGLAPQEIFNWETLFTLKGFIVLIIGGFLIGFGTRYAGGCTSGHAITGLSELQLPSLIAVIGFFIGGLIMTFLILPYILTL